MCGIYGCITKSNRKLTTQEKFLRGRVLSSMALAMQDRGTDSTGIATIKDKEVKIVKKAKNATELIEDKKFQEVIANGYNIIIGHTRLATVGEINNENAHPFKKNQIIGCHNGSVYNWKEWEEEGKLKVDSEAIFYLLNKNKNDYKKTFKQLRGNFAIVWTNLKEPNSLYLACNNNPLYVVRIPEIDTIFFLSELYYLQAIINSVFGLEGKQIFKAKEDTCYRVSQKLTIKKEDIEFNEFTSYIKDYDYSNKKIIEYDEKQANENTKIKYEEEDINEHDSLIYEDEQVYQILQFPECIGCDRSISTKIGFWINDDTFEAKCFNCITLGDRNSKYSFLTSKDYIELLNIYRASHIKYEKILNYK